MTEAAWGLVSILMLVFVACLLGMVALSKAHLARKKLREVSGELAKALGRSGRLEEQCERLRAERDVARAHLDRWRSRMIGARPGGPYEDVQEGP